MQQVVRQEWLLRALGKPDALEISYRYTIVRGRRARQAQYRQDRRQYLNQETSLERNDRNGTSRTLFEVNSNGFKTIREIFHRRIFRYLFSLSNKYINRQYRQLVAFSFDFISLHINIDGVFEKKELETFFAWVTAKGNIFDGAAIDVGANIGNHSLYFSDYFETVYSFEPNPRTFKVLQLNAALVSNVICHELGISNVERDATMNVYANNIGHSKISEAAEGSGEHIKLKLLDSVIPADKKISMIKYDVEGHEYQAILGSQATIKKYQPVILFEQLRSEFESGSSKVIDLLKKSGYSKFATVMGSRRKLKSNHRLFDLLLNVLNRIPLGRSILFGTTWSVVVHEQFAPADYPFLVAIPHWVQTNDKL